MRMTEPREITDRYRLEKILKSSRTGNVLRAADVRSGKTVVVKMINLGPAAQAGMERFERLAAALAGSLHPSFPEVLDSGVTTDGSAFLVFENLEGRGFESLAGGRGLRVVQLIGQVLDGLEALRERGLFHGNLSPDNLLVIRPQADGVKTFGLGTACFRTPEAAGADPQNARFRAPEELGPPSAALPDEARWRSDLYSLALTACQVLGIEVTFGDTPTPKVAIPTVLGFELKEPAALRGLLEGALRRKPEDRPTLAQARNSLRRAAGLPPVQEKPAAAARPTPPVPPAPAASPAPPTPPMPPAPASLEHTRPTFFPDAPAAPEQEPEPLGGPPPARPAAAPAAALGALDLPPLPPLSSADESALSAGLSPVDRPPRPVAVPPPATGPSPAGREELEDSKLSFDDALLDDLPPAPPPVLPVNTAAPTGRVAPSGRTGAVPAAAPATPAIAGPRPRKEGVLDRLLKPVPLAAAGGALLALVLGLAWFLGRGAPPPPRPIAVAPPRPAVPTPPPSPPPAARLATARSYAAQGQEHEALVALRSLTPADQQALAPPDAAAFHTLQDTLTKNAAVRVPNDLAAGWKAKDLALLRGAVEDAALVPAGALPPAAQADLARARPVVDLYDRALAAEAQGQAVEALDRFAEMAKLLPGVRDASGLRDRAAAKLETETDALVRDAHYDEAIAHLEPLSRTWPDRPGLKAKLAEIRAQQKAEHTVELALADAEAAEKTKKPEGGLAALRKVKPTPHLEPVYNDLRQRLETLLGQYDQKPPEVELRDGYLLDYDRGTPVNLSFRIRDDYKVESVKVYARPGSGGKMVELPFTRNGFTYTVVIAPAFHQNQTVEFYVVATDPSGHETSLGSRDKPLQLKRKKGFREN
jgi:serine/threonine protein kinase